MEKYDLLIVFLLLMTSLVNHSNAKGCNKTVRTTRTVRSPQVTSQNKGKPLHCIFRFMKYSNSDKVFEINFRAFHVGTPVNGSSCGRGYVQLIDNHLRNASTSGYFCGRMRTGRTYLSETESVTLVFHVENYTKRFYFRAQSSVLPKLLAHERHKEMVFNGEGTLVPGTFCDRNYANCNAGGCRIVSPGYPGFYPRNLTCIYRLFYNESKVEGRLTLGGHYHDNFDVWVDDRCSGRFCSKPKVTSVCPNDYLHVYDVLKDQTLSVGRFCGRGELPRIVSRDRQLLLEFVTSVAGSINYDGFNLQVVPTQVYQPGRSMVNNECSWVFVETASTSQGQFHSLHHWYPEGTKCSYRFVGAPGHRVWIHFTSFYAPRDDTCDDRLVFYDSIPHTFCGRHAPNETTLSDSNAYQIEFQSRFGSYDGSQFEFSAFYMFIETESSGQHVPGTDCDEIFDSERSPKGNFDFFKNRLRLRKKSVRCSFSFSGRPTEQVKVLFSNLSFDSTRHCIGAQKRNCWDDGGMDRLLVFDGHGARVACVCSPASLPLEFASTELKFHLFLSNVHAMAYRDSDLYVFRGKFEFLQLGCGQSHLSGPQGSLVYPSVPQRSGDAVHCRWTIEVGKNKSVLLKFQYLHLPGSNCTFSRLRAFLQGRKEHYLELCPGSRQTEALPVGWHNVAAIPRPSNKLVIELLAPSTTQAGFKLHWSEVNHAYRYQSSLQRSVENEACEFKCPDKRTCISRYLLCDGYVDCPQSNFTGHPLDEAYTQCPQVDWLIYWLLVSLAISFTVVMTICLVLVGLWRWRKHVSNVPK